MELKWLAMVLVVLSLGVGLCDGCLEEERFALFQLEPFFEFINYRVQYLEFESYPGKESSSNCCEWERVECNLITGRVTHLFLNDSSYNKMHWHLNASLFLPFEELQILSLSGNFIAGCVANQGFERLSSKLDKLENLDLSENNFNDSILASLSEFSSLRSLNLANNIFTGSNPTNDKSIEMLSKLNNLETLDLSGNSLGNNILSQLNERNNSWMNLKELNLGGNEIESLGSLFHEKEGMKFNKLEVLSLRNNLFNNSIFSSLVELSNLKSLDLTANQLEGAIYTKDLNALSNLEELILSSNKVNGFIPSQGLRLMNLKVVELSGNDFNNSIMSSLATLSNLKTLRIDIPKCNGLIDMKDLNALSNLKELKLFFSGNEVNGFVPSQDAGAGCSFSLQSLGLFPTLKTLSLDGFNINETTLASYSHNNLYGFTHLEELNMACTPGAGCSFSLQSLGLFPTLKTLFLFGFNINETTMSSYSHNSNKLYFIEAFKSLTLLESLDLSSNQFSGNISALKSLTLLESLGLSSNQFSGNISALKSLTLLESLDLSSNQFSGNIFALESLTSLQLLDISNNKFHIPSSLRPLFNLSKLKYLNAENNTIHADDHEMLHSSAPRFQLYSISLSCCGSGGSFPQFLYHQSELQEVTLSDIYFKVDRFPFWLLENNTMLGSLDLMNCSLSGPFQLPSCAHLALSYLDISNNAFVGNIPLRIGAHLPSLSNLNMSRNYFNGSIPSVFGDMSSLRVLDLSNNQLSGEIPEHMAMGCSLLQILALSNNSLQGSIFSENFNLTSLSELELNGNNFTGMIPNVLANCSDLYILDLSNNFIFGEVPSWIWNMPMLAALDVSRNHLFGRLPKLRGNGSNLEQVAMADNRLKGTIPRAICSLNLKLQFLDLSMNSLSGTLPSCFKPVSAREVLLSKNMLQGPLPNAFRDSSSLMILDLNYNHLKGNIPNWVSNLSYLSYLLLKGNHFEGEIPIQLCKLNNLSLVDLSQNNLSGSIPSCLKVVALNYVINQNFSYFINNYYSVSLNSIEYFRSLVNNSRISSKSIDVSVEYTVKSRSYNYKKRMLQYMSGIDLSCNKLTGEISFETKNIMQLFTLNLSHNSLTGPIPQAFSNLGGMESLDLSYNKLTGNIPVEFAVLHFLGYFNVSYNNLSGKTPERIGQLGAFDESSYVGNPFLCGSLVGKNCSFLGPPLTPKDSTGNKENHRFIDMDAFYASFFACYMMVLLCIAAVLYINPYRRQAWLYYVQMVVNSCYYFVIDNLSPKNFCNGNM
ncbi:receptor-like protein 12 isoform X1 [Gossypium australe]|uniref:Receptor-like protein 12 isoform X1 n=1 Tax=Gossypium australe TaxID=47621 RepID=A0A5B6WBF4_9ROSI|nr:receptor-like protein 12 isoform X1 [Gossypium australe]